MKNFIVPFAVAILGSATMAGTTPGDLSDLNSNIINDFPMLVEVVTQSTKCETKTGELASYYCGTDSSCAEEI